MLPMPVTLEGNLVRLEPLTVTHAAELWTAFVVDPSIWQWWTIDAPTSAAEMEALPASRLKAVTCENSS